MAAQMAIIRHAKALTPLLSRFPPHRLISSSPFLFQEPLAEATPASSTPLPPNPSSGSPLYQENWRNPKSQEESSLVPASTGFSVPSLQSSARILTYSQTLDMVGLMNVFADCMTEQRWDDLKQLFEYWVRSLDGVGKPNRPDVNIYNHYLRANLMTKASAAELLDLVAQMEDYDISPNTASYNLVLKAMCEADETEASQKLLDRMLQLQAICLPDDESYNLVISLLFSRNQIDSALKYLDLMLKSGYMVSMDVFEECARKCVRAGKLDTLASIIEKCKAMEQNKALCPNWNLCNFLLNAALEADHSKLAYFGLEFLARWIRRGEIARPAVLLSVEEGLAVSAMGVACRTYSPTLLVGSWDILRHSLRQKKPPNAESYLGKICAFASLGNLQGAFTTLGELENVYGDSLEAEELFSPFTSLKPLVDACCKNGFTTLDSVYFQLENMSRADTPYKSLAALNCIILGSANIWDLERAYETFEAVNKTFGLTPNIHSYNALLRAFGKHRKTEEALNVFGHLTSMSVKPNAMTYSLLVEAHLVNRDHRTALTMIDEMVNAGYAPSKETLGKIRRRCLRESDFDSNDQVQVLAKKFSYRMTGEARREQLFNLQFTTEYS